MLNAIVVDDCDGVTVFKTISEDVLDIWDSEFGVERGTEMVVFV